MKKIINLQNILTISLAIIMMGCGKQGNPVWISPIDPVKVPVRVTHDNSADVLSGPLSFNLESSTFHTRRPLTYLTEARYTEIEAEHVPDRKNHNHIEFSKGVRKILIKAKDLTLKKGHENKIFESFHESNDIIKFTIEADSVRILDSLHIPGAEINIYARTLYIAGGASVSNKPLDKESRPSGLGENGVDGIHTASMNVFVKDLKIDGEKRAVFILDGGNGQNPGTGRDGVPGRSVNAGCGGNVVYRNYMFCPAPMDNLKRREPGDRCRQRSCGRNEWPGNGGDAVAAGKPGNAGDSGNLFSNLVIERELISFKPGIAGEKGRVYVGGAAGNPRPAVHDLGHNVSRTTSRGSDKESPSAEVLKGKSGNFFHTGEKHHWLSEGFVEMLQKYARDLYIANHVLEAKLVYSDIVNQIEEFDVLTKNYKWIKVVGECQKEIFKIERHLDFFSHPAGWVSNLSFEVSYLTFEKEIERALDSLYLVYWLKNTKADLDQKLQAIEVTKTNIQKKIKSDLESHKILAAKLPDLRHELKSLETRENELREEITELENRLKNSIKNKKKFKFAINAFRAITTVIPAGQPAIGVIGNGLATMMNKFNSNESEGWFSTLYDTYGHLTKMNLEDSVKDWNSRYVSLSLGEFSNMTAGERMERLKKFYEFSRPVIQEIMKQRERYRDLETSFSSIERELRKARSVHPELKPLSEKLLALAYRRRVVGHRLSTTLRQLAKLQQDVNAGFVSIAEVDRRTQIMQKGTDSSLNYYLDQMKESSEEKLMSYHYRISRAFEYRLLIPYPLQLDLSVITDKMKDLIVANQEDFYLSKQQFDALKSVYTNQLSEITKRVLDETENDVPRSSSKSIVLSQKEISALNKGESIYLNLMDSSIYGDDKEDIRISKIELENVEVSYDSNDRRFAEADLLVKYLGRSYFEKRGKRFFFEYDDTTKARNMVWGINIDAIHMKSKEIVPAISRRSLLLTILGSDMKETMLYSRPGGLTQFEIKLNTNSYDNVPVVLTSATVVINYDYRMK